MASGCSGFFRNCGLIIGVPSIILSLWGLWKIYSILNEVENASYWKKAFYLLISKDFKTAKTSLKAGAVWCVINVVASLLLLLGIVKQCHSLLWPWLIINGLYICLATIALVIQLQKEDFNAEKMPLYVGGLVLLSVLYLLMFLVYKEIQGSRGGGGGYSRGRAPRVVAMQSQTMNIY